MEKHWTFHKNLTNVNHKLNTFVTNPTEMTSGARNDANM